MEVIAEHFHILLSFSSKRSIGKVVLIIKSISASDVFSAFPTSKRRLCCLDCCGKTVISRVQSETA